MPIISISPRALLSLLIFATISTPIEGRESETTSSHSPLRGGVRRGSERRDLIIGGEDVVVKDPDRYPYFALMQGWSQCGAVLISKRFVLTAAHCVGADNDFQIGVTETTGFLESLWGDASAPEFRFRNRIIHEDYNGDSLSNDIAIYELDRDVPDSLPYIALEQTPLTEEDLDQELVVIGFGDTNPSDFIDVSSDSLLQGTVGYVPPDECISRMPYGSNISPDMLCAYAPGTDSCGGDSGGPLLLQGDTPLDDTLVGLVSWGYSCAGSTPGVYTRISYFYKWIVDQMCAMNPSGVPAGVVCPNTEPTIDAPGGDSGIWEEDNGTDDFLGGLLDGVDAGDLDSILDGIGGDGDDFLGGLLDGVGAGDLDDILDGIGGDGDDFLGGILDSIGGGSDDILGGIFGDDLGGDDFLGGVFGDDLGDGDDLLGGNDDFLGDWFGEGLFGEDSVVGGLWEATTEFLSGAGDWISGLFGGR